MIMAPTMMTTTTKYATHPSQCNCRGTITIQLFCSGKPRKQAAVRVSFSGLRVARPVGADPLNM